MKSEKLKLKLMKHEKNYLELLITGSEPAFVNALRRTVIAEVPVMAIDEVIFYENTSPMFDEYIAHRLALIPLTTDLKTYKIPEEEKDYAAYGVTLTLDEVGPKIVYSSALHTSDPKVKPVSGKIPIIELLEGQRLRLEARAILGRGEEHVKWQAGNASYKMLPQLETTGKIENVEELVKNCPKKALGTKKEKLVLEKPWECTMCMYCVDSAEPKNLKLTQDRTSFLFKLETNGSLTAVETLETALKLLKEKNESMKKELSTAKIKNK